MSTHTIHQKTRGCKKNLSRIGRPGGSGGAVESSARRPFRSAAAHNAPRPPATLRRRPLRYAAARNAPSTRHGVARRKHWPADAGESPHGTSLGLECRSAGYRSGLSGMVPEAAARSGRIFEDRRRPANGDARRRPLPPSARRGVSESLARRRGRIAARNVPRLGMPVRRKPLRFVREGSGGRSAHRADLRGPRSPRQR